jgi:hypothetical protein
MTPHLQGRQVLTPGPGASVRAVTYTEDSRS